MTEERFEVPNDPYEVVDRNDEEYDLKDNNTYNFEGFRPGDGSGGKDCTDYDVWGVPSTLYSYIVKGNSNPATYPKDACDPYYHKTGQIDNLRINVDLQGPSGTGAFNVNSTLVTFSGDVHVIGDIYNTEDGWSLSSTGFSGPVSGNVTATSITLNSVAITATGTEINYTDGVTSNIQTQLDAKISLSTLKTEVAASTDFADFKSRIAALT